MGDLSRLETALSDDGVWFTPLDYEGNEIEYEFLVLGSDSKVARKAASEKNAKILEAIYDRKKSRKSASIDDVAETQPIFLSKIVKGWRNKETKEETLLFRGKALECTEANIVTVLEALPAIADQIDRKCAARADFTKPVSEN